MSWYNTSCPPPPSEPRQVPSSPAAGVPQAGACPQPQVRERHPQQCQTCQPWAGTPVTAPAPTSRTHFGTACEVSPVHFRERPREANEQHRAPAGAGDLAGDLPASSWRGGGRGGRGRSPARPGGGGGQSGPRGWTRARAALTAGAASVSRVGPMRSWSRGEACM